jgi:hypothetical protein
MEALDRADLCIMLLRFRSWPDSQMAHFVNYYLRGGPIIALRTSTHAFDYPVESTSAYKKYGWQSKEWPGGLGKQVLGENWVSHWGDHGKQATRGVIEPTQAQNPVLRGVKDIFGTTDVYEAAPPSDVQVLVRGQVLQGMSPTDPPATGTKKTASGSDQDLNRPMMPIAWIRERKNEAGKVNKMLVTTMGAATDLLNEDLRRLLVNAAYWSTGLAKKIASRADVRLVGSFQPSPFGFDGFKRGVKPQDVQRNADSTTSFRLE